MEIVIIMSQMAEGYLGHCPVFFPYTSWTMNLVQPHGPMMFEDIVVSYNVGHDLMHFQNKHCWRSEQICTNLKFIRVLLFDDLGKFMDSVAFYTQIL